MSSFKKAVSATLVSLFVAAVPAWSASDVVDVVPGSAQAAQTEAVTQADSKVVAKVNGNTITQLDVDRAAKVLMAENHIPDPPPAATKKKADEAALNQLISAELLYQAGALLPVADLDQKIEDRLTQYRARFKTEEEFHKALKAVSLTPEDLKEYTRKEIIIANLLDTKFKEKATATDAEAKKFYDDNLDKYFTTPETIRASHILIAVDAKATPADKTKAKEKAEGILAKIKAGADFATLAKAESSDPSNVQGGDLGYFTKGQMVPEFEKAAFALKKGEVSGVVETQFGYHIIKVTDLKPGHTATFDEVKEKIVDFLKKEKTRDAINDYLKELRKSAQIELN